MKTLCLAAQVLALGTIFATLAPVGRNAVILTVLLVINNLAVQFRTYFVLKPLIRPSELDQ